MKKLSIILSILLLIQIQAIAQRKMQQLDEDEAKKQQEYDKITNQGGFFNSEKWSFGGNIGAQFVKSPIYSSFVMAQPSAGYLVAKKTLVGVSLTYIYSWNNDYGNAYSSNIIGPSLYGRQFILPQVFAHAELQTLRFHSVDRNTSNELLLWENAMFVGGGYGERKGPQIVALYNVLWSSTSRIYGGSPWVIRIGFMF